MTSNHQWVRWILALVGCLALLLLVESCSRQSPIPMSVRRLYLVILEEKDEAGRYRTLIKEEGSTTPKPFIAIKEIEGFDRHYQEGQRYQIIVKELTSRGEIRFIWTGKNWPE
ncbi:MAG: hypothetical protein PUJ69_04330 [Porphyromonas somerae]|uniref:hypothetical protein n=1 Tax=Porphyromonas somerae TaxID=322095 RepID=UPI0026EE298F|nr:hypothetical protein [Porphyromonas somerae]MDD7557883.1 hypothetical protein [Porphyromonas somerae]MDY5816166.1 hypothetical protein [Porphyromonas somerae]